MTARVFVTLKPSVFDPQGHTITEALHQMGYAGVEDVRQGKYFELDAAGTQRRGVAGAGSRSGAQAARQSGDRELPHRGRPNEVRHRRVSRDRTATTTRTTRPSTCSGRTREFVWHKETDLHGADVVILPGGFAHGDYLRTGAIARFSPVMEAVQTFAAAGGPVIGICNGFQVLLEAGLLPGAMLRNTDMYRCQFVHVRVEQTDTPFTSLCTPGQVLKIPIAHGEGNYYADPDAVERARAEPAGDLPLRLARGRGDERGQPERVASATSPASATARATSSA